MYWETLGSLQDPLPTFCTLKEALGYTGRVLRDPLSVSCSFGVVLGYTGRTCIYFLLLLGGTGIYWARSSYEPVVAIEAAGINWEALGDPLPTGTEGGSWGA